MSQLTSQLLGSWRMTSWTFEVLETGEVKDALGKNPRGYINYSPDGRVMVLVLHEDRPMPKALVPTSEEKISLYDTMFAYAGTYSVENDRVIHQVDMSWNKAWEAQSRSGLLKWTVGPSLTKLLQQRTHSTVSTASILCGLKRFERLQLICPLRVIRYLGIGPQRRPMSAMSPIATKFSEATK